VRQRMKKWMQEKKDEEVKDCVEKADQ